MSHGFVCVGGPLDGQRKVMEPGRSSFEVAEAPDLTRFGSYADDNPTPAHATLTCKIHRYILKDHAVHGAAWVFEPST